MEKCPRCGAELFEDMDVCYGCLYDFTKPIEQVYAEEKDTRTAQDEVNAFAEWANLNTPGIRAMYKKALSLASRGRHISTNYLLEWLRYDSNVAIQGVSNPGDFKAPNHFATIFARYLTEENPGLEECMRLSGSRYDNPRIKFPPIDWGYPK